MKPKIIFPICIAIGAYSCSTKEVIKPNIIVILADDMGYGDICALNRSAKVVTPALDSMVNSGIAFTDAHTNSSVSTPTRYGVLTGRYAFRSRMKKGVLNGYDSLLIENDRETIASLLKNDGYNTGCVGKWHLGLNWGLKDTTKPIFEESVRTFLTKTNNVDYAAYIDGGPNSVGFDYSYIMPASLDIAPYFYIENGKVTNDSYIETPAWRDTTARGMWYREGIAADDFDHNKSLQHFTDQSIKFIENASTKEEPFFLYFPLTAPHSPWLPSKEFRGVSKAGIYGDFICMVDDVVAQIYETLEKTGEAENTIVIFTSDNGSMWTKADIKKFGHHANGMLSGTKFDLWEGGHRVPFLVTWPKQIKSSKVCDKIICTTDFLATFADMIGSPLSQNDGEDSYSFWSVITGECTNDEPLRPAIVHHSGSGEFGLRMGDLVLIDCNGSGGWTLPESKAPKTKYGCQLYNLKEDISQKNNIAEQFPDKITEMRSILNKYKTSDSSRP